MPRPVTLKMVSESCVTWVTSVPILVPLCSQLRPDVRDRQTLETDVRQAETASSLNVAAY